jgi:hypothetical protein
MSKKDRKQRAAQLRDQLRDVPRDVKVTVGDLQLDEFMTLMNCASLGAAAMLQPDLDGDSLGRLARMVENGLYAVGPDRWNAMMQRFYEIGTAAMAKHGIAGVESNIKLDLGPGPHRGPVQ